jgi:hypothetical protein
MKRSKRIPIFSIIVGIAVVYLFQISPQGDAGRIYTQVLAIVHQGALSVNDYRDIYPSIPDVSEYQGLFYPGVAPGLTFLSVPIYALFRSILGFVSSPLFPGFPNAEFSLILLPLTIAISSIPTLLTAFLLYRYAQIRGLIVPQALGIAVLYALASPAFTYGVSYSYESLVNLLSFFAFLEVIRPPHELHREQLIGTGFSLGMLPLLWYPVGMISVIMGSILIYRVPRRALQYALPAFLVPVTCLFLYNWVVFDHPFSLPYHHRFTGGASSVEGPFLGSGFPSFQIAIKLLVGSRRGLFLTMPMAALAMLSIIKVISWKGEKGSFDLRVAWVIFIAFFLWNTSRPVFWHSGTGLFGPRYLMPVIPFFFVMLIHVFHWIPNVLLSVLGAISFVVNLAGAHYKQQWDVDSIAMFVLRGPRFPFVEWLNSIPVEARTRFPDLFPASQSGFAFAFIVLSLTYAGFIVLLMQGERKDNL